MTETSSRSWSKAPVLGERIRLKGGVVDFTDLIPMYGKIFVARLLDDFARCHVDGLARYPDKQSFILRKFLQYAATGRVHNRISAVCDLYAALAEGACPSKSVIEAAVHDFVERLRDVDDHSVICSSKITTRRGHIEFLGMIVRDLSVYGMWPRIGRLHLAIGLRASGNNIPSLGELRMSRGHQDQSVSAPMSEVMHLNRTGLAALRAALADEFEAHWAIYELGSARIARPGLPSIADIEAAIASIPMNYNGKGFASIDHPNFHRCFPDDDPELRVSSMLKYLSEKHGGVVRTGSDYKWHRLVKSCGGIRNLSDQLGGSGRAMSLAHALVIVDTGFNVQPCTDLRADPVYLQAHKGKQVLSTITSVKMRAAGKIVQAVLKEYEASVTLKGQSGQVSALTVITRWQAMSARYRARAIVDGRGLERYLWIRPRSTNNNGADIGLAPNNAGWWASISSDLQKMPELEGVRVTRQNIRTTVLQIRLADAGLDVAAVARLASHGSQATTVRHYLNRGWFKSEMDELIRRFQSLFEASLMENISDPAGRLGLTEEQLAERRAGAVETGLGFLCSDAYTGYAPGSTTGSACDQLHACANCKMLRFSPTSTSLQALIVTELSLTRAEADFVVRNPERWALYWLPTLALARATISRLREGPWAGHITRAEKAVTAQLASAEMHLVQPW